MTDLILNQQTLENRRVLLSVELPPHRLDEAMRTVARRLSREYRFPGFRPGKVPYPVVVQRIGRENLLREVAASLGETVLREALDATGIEPYGPIDLQQLTLEPLVYQFEIPLAPKVEVGDYRSIRIEPPVLDEAMVEEHIQGHLQELREQHKTWQVVERPAQYGDQLTVDFRLEVDGEVVLSNEDWDFVPNATDYTLVPEFDAAFIGMSAGEQKTFSAVFPEDSQWPGKEGRFTITVKAVKTQQAPELTDELAQQAGYDNVADLLADLRTHAEALIRAQQNEVYLEQVLRAVLEQSQIEFAPSTLQAMLDSMLEDEARQFKSYGIDSVEEYLQLIRKTRETYDEERRATAETRLREQLVLQAIMDREQFPVSEFELDRELRERYGHNEALLQKAQKLLATDQAFRERIALYVRLHKTLDLLKRIAQGEAVPAPGEHQAEEAPPTAVAAPSATEAPGTSQAEEAPSRAPAPSEGEAAAEAENEPAAMAVVAET
jgi:trigger factor